MKVDATYHLCATLGLPNRGSRAPIMHNAGFEHLGLPFVYLAFEPKPEGLADAFRGMRGLGIRGFSVTKPYKEAVIPFLDDLDPVARAIGAVNTVLNDGGRLVGYNSDWVGAVSALEEASPIAGKKVVLLGAGGAGRAVAYGLRKAGGLVRVYNRTAEKAASLAKEFGLEGAGTMDDIVPDWDILVNTTSVGMKGAGEEGKSPLPRGFFEGKGGKGVVLDAIVVPRITPLLAEAERAGLATVNGARMTLLQGAFQFKLFTGKDAPLDAMEKALLASL